MYMLEQSGREENKKGPKIQKQRKKHLSLAGNAACGLLPLSLRPELCDMAAPRRLGSVATFKVRASEVKMNDNGFEVSIHSLPRGSTKGFHGSISLTGH